MNRSRLVFLGVTVTSLLLLLVISLIVVGLQITTPLTRSPATTTPTTSASALADTPVTTRPMVQRNIHRVLPVPPDMGISPDLLILNQNLSSRASTLLYLDNDQQAIRWETSRLNQIGPQTPVVTGATQVYLVDQERLLAFDRQDGTLRWEATLPATVSPLCQECVRVEGEYVLVLTQNGIVQSRAVTDGTRVWQVRLDGTPRQLLVIDDQIGVLNRAEANRPWAVLELLAVADGTLVRRIEAVCPDPAGVLADVYPALTTPVFFAEEEQALYLLFGTTNSCVQRIDSRSGALIWRTSPTQRLPPDWTSSTPLLAEGTLYIGVGGTILAVDRADGHMRQLTSEPDYNLTPVAARDGVLVVAVRRARGTPQPALWGLDAASGTQRWQYDLPSARRSGRDTGVRDWASHLTADGLAVIQRFPNQLQIETLSITDGTAISQTTTSLHDQVTVWRDIVWGDTLAWLTFQRLYAIDLTTGTVAYIWPET
mgnify:CR=1 FL=1